MLPARVVGYRPAMLDELCTSGEVVWTGAGAIGARDGRIRLCFADQIALLAPGWDTLEPPDGELHEAIRGFLAERGASFWGQLREAAPVANDTELLVALWDLVWSGEVTNDSLAPLRSVLAGGGVTPSKRSAKRSAAARAPVASPDSGRRPARDAGASWRRCSNPGRRATEAAHAQALQLLERYGVVTREAVLAEGVLGGYASVYGVLKVLEERGRTRRGYFVAGLGAAQFALPGAVDRLRAARETSIADTLGGGHVPSTLVLAATDPAQPYGAALPWPATAGRPARNVSSLVILREGVPMVWFDRRGHHVVLFPAGVDDPAWAAALAGLVTTGRERSVEVRKVDGGPVADSVASVLRSAGFVDGYRGLVLRA